MAASTKSQSRGANDQNSQQKQKHKNLTDRLVFYPSSNNIADYNSSMNLNYMGYTKDGPEPQQTLQARQQSYVRQASPGEHRKQQQQLQQLQHLQQKQQQLQQQQQQQMHGEHMHQEDVGDVRNFMRSSSVPARTVYCPEYGESLNGNNRYISNQSGYVSISSQQIQHNVVPYPSGQPSGIDKKDPVIAGNHKYLNKFSQWIPDNLKLKRISKRYRSHSLPAVADSDDDSIMQQLPKGKGTTVISQDKRLYGKPQKDANSKSTIFTSPIKSGRSFLQRKSHSLTTPLTREEKSSSKKKKRSITSTMTNLMQKANVYRRHSFSHSTLTNECSELDDARQISRHQMQFSGGQSSKFLITKPPNQTYSQSDPESVYSDFFSDNEDKSASVMGDRFIDKDLCNVANIFATMDQSVVQQRLDSRESDQGTENFIWIRLGKWRENVEENSC